MNRRQSQFTTPIPILCLDPIEHTDDRLYCGDETCPCMDELYTEVERREREYLRDFTAGPEETTGTHAPDCRCGYCEPDEEINTYFRCAVHNTTLSVRGNSYYCRACGCAPEKMEV